VTEVSRRSTRIGVIQKKGGTVVSRRKERARMVYERRSPKGQNQAGRGRASEEARWRVRRAQKVGGETCCRQQGRRGCRWHVLASRRRMRGWWLIIESVAAGQNGLVNVGHVITVVRILTVGQGEQVEKQWKCVDPCKSHHYARWKNPGNGSFDGVKVRRKWGRRSNRYPSWRHGYGSVCIKK